LFISNDGTCSLKFSFLKDYNDPYEFFLTIDYNQSPEILAYYGEIVSMVAQEQPVTCFSKSPLITPMWAHYADNSRGFVAEIDEDRLIDWLKGVAEDSYSFGDIDYQDEPHEELNELLGHAYVTCKPRHVAWLRDAVASAAFFTKQQCWSYEQERRLLVGRSAIPGGPVGLMLMHIPAECITSVVVGSAASKETRDTLREMARASGWRYLEQRIGRSSASSYCIDEKKATYIFNGHELIEKQNRCGACLEPLDEGQICSWCKMTESHQEDAARRNAFRVLHHAGILGEYLRGFRAIGEEFEK
jgi:hypothetical protein